MNRTQLIDLVARRAGLTKGQARDAVNETFDILSESLARGRSVTVHGFGVFAPRTVGASRPDGRWVAKFTPGAGMRSR